MILFFDTSALIKFFHEEDGTDVVTKLITSKDNEVWILDLCRLEFISALYRRFRNNEIDENILNEAINGFEEEITRFQVEPLSQIVIHEAESLLKKYGKKHGLRTLDSLHLGCFSLVSEENWYFVAADENLCRVVESMGFKTINPIKNNYSREL